ncbi:MAG: hypothetical protein PHH11_12655 [Methylomonas sp.]|nr:hypothetical protein [Methylomonas sp.]
MTKPLPVSLASFFDFAFLIFAISPFSKDHRKITLSPNQLHKPLDFGIADQA